MQTLENKVAIVTGATSGIGKATALAFAEAGAKVVVSGRREREGNMVVDEIRAKGGVAMFVKTDVSKEADLKAMVDKTIAEYGRLDIAFNNAGIEGDFGAFTADQTEEHYQRVFDINVKGVLLSMKHEIPHLLDNGGAIVNTTSIAASVGLPGAATYVASKHAVLGLTRTAALEYAAQGIRINTISPGGIETPMLERFVGSKQEASENREFIQGKHPMGRLGTPEEIAAAVVFLASPQASFITGADLLADGGWTVQ